MAIGSDTTERVGRPPRAGGIALTTLGVMGIFAVLVVLGEADYLAYHSVIEILVSAVGFTIFAIAWHTRRLVDDDYLTVLGVAQLLVAGTTVLHLLTYSGMSVFPTATVTMGSQFWIVTRILQAAGLVAAPAFIGRCLRRPIAAVAAFAVPAAIAVYAVFAGVFPPTFLQGEGLTPFKIEAEWAIVAGMALGLWLLWRRRDRFERRVLLDLSAAIGLMIAAELTFTAYSTLFDTFNVVGHILHLASFYFIYRALVAHSLENPFSVLFRQLAQREEALREEYHFSEGLNGIAAAIGTSLDPDAILNAAIVEAAHVAGADGATVSVYEGSGEFEVRNVFGERFESLAHLTLDRTQAPYLFLASESGDPVVITDTQVDALGRQVLERSGTRSLMSIPLITRGQATGVLSLHWLEPSSAVTSPRLMMFARKLGASLSLALANARLYEGEHRVAETLQDAMLAAIETTAEVEAGSVYRSAPGIGKIGGDFLDVFELGNGTLAFVLGDVAGKGIEAAATNALARSTFRALGYRNPSRPAKVLAGANEALRRQLRPGEFVTAVFGVLDPADGSVTVGLAGHPEPVVCGQPGLVPDDALRNPPLAVVTGHAFQVWDFRMAPHDALVMFSDGICEARRGTEMFGIERVRHVLDTCADRSCQQIAESLLAAADDFSGGDSRDDIAVLVLRPLQAEAERQDLGAAACGVDPAITTR